MSLAADITEAAAKAIHRAEVDRYRLRTDTTWEQALDTTKAEYLADARAALAAALDALALHEETRRYGCFPMDLEALAEEMREVPA